MAKRPKRPAKRLDVLEAVREKVAADEFRDTRHTGAGMGPGAT